MAKRGPRPLTPEEHLDREIRTLLDQLCQEFMDGGDEGDLGVIKYALEFLLRHFTHQQLALMQSEGRLMQ